MKPVYPQIMHGIWMQGWEKMHKPVSKNAVQKNSHGSEFRPGGRKFKEVQYNACALFPHPDWMMILQSLFFLSLDQTPFLEGTEFFDRSLFRSTSLLNTSWTQNTMLEDLRTSTRWYVGTSQKMCKRFVKNDRAVSILQIVCINCT